MTPNQSGINFELGSDTKGQSEPAWFTPGTKKNFYGQPTEKNLKNVQKSNNFLKLLPIMIET